MRSGRVSIGMIQWLGPVDLPAELSAFHRLHPGIQITVLNVPVDALVGGLRSGELDLAYLASDDGLPDDLEGRTVYREPLRLIMPLDHPLAGHGRVRWADLDDEPLVLFSEGSAVTAIVLVRQLSVISENGRLMLRLQTLANVDQLTGIPNRRAFFEEADHLFDGTATPAGAHTVLMVDVDYFKAVNDTFGHQAGDRVLSVVAACVKSQLRAADLVGRYGGDEMVILLAECSGPAALAWAPSVPRVSVSVLPVPPATSVAPGTCAARAWAAAC